MWIFTGNRGHGTCEGVDQAGPKKSLEEECSDMGTHSVRGFVTFVAQRGRFAQDVVLAFGVPTPEHFPLEETRARVGETGPRLPPG